MAGIAVIGVLIAGTGLLSALGFLFPPLGRMSQQFQNSKFPNEIPDMFTLADMTAKGIMDGEDYFRYSQQQGFQSGLAHFFLNNAKTHLQAMDCVTAWRRGYIDEDAVDRRLKLLKFDPVDINVIKQISLYFPTPSDLVSFAVREVYSPDIVDKFGQMEGVPDKYLQECQKAGLPQDQAKNYWAAHWNLPSITQGFEMFHRRVIEQDELFMLLKALDVMPFWREKLKDISYNPLTRVDVRRMYGLGVLNADDVYNSYLDIGYSPENAQRMTDFTIAYENDEMNGITRSSLIDSYKDGIITREQLASYLEGLRYTPEVIEYWLEQADYEKTLEDIKIYTKDLTELYQKGAIDISEMRTFLLQADLPAKYIDQVLEKTILAKAPKVKVPTLETLTNWLEQNLIDETYYVEQLRLLGYRDRDIQIYLTQIAEHIDTTDRKFLPIETYKRWFLKYIISQDDFINIMREMKVSEKDINTMIDEIKGIQSESESTT